MKTKPPKLLLLLQCWLTHLSKLGWDLVIAEAIAYDSHHFHTYPTAQWFSALAHFPRTWWTVTHPTILLYFQSSFTIFLTSGRVHAGHEHCTVLNVWPLERGNAVAHSINILMGVVCFRVTLPLTILCSNHNDMVMKNWRRGRPLCAPHLDCAHTGSFHVCFKELGAMFPCGHIHITLSVCKY